MAEDAAHDHVPDVGWIDASAGDGRGEHGGEEVVRGGVLQGAAAGTGEGGTERRDNDDVLGGIAVALVAGGVTSASGDGGLEGGKRKERGGSPLVVDVSGCAWTMTKKRNVRAI